MSVEVFDGRFEEKYGDDLEIFAAKATGGMRFMLREAELKGNDSRERAYKESQSSTEAG